MLDEYLLVLLRISVFFFAAGALWFVYSRQIHRLKRLKAANMHSAVVLLHKRHAGNMDYSSYNGIERIDGLRTETFIYRLGVPAVYLAPGEHVVEARANWSRRIRGNRMKEFSVGPRNVHVSVESGEFWSMEYCISRNEFVFEKCDPDHLFKKAK